MSAGATARRGLGLSEEHVALHDAVRGWAARHCPPEVPRALLDAPDEGLPPFWEDMKGAGWLGLHVGEDAGGEGYGLAELAIVLEELGRVVAPGPFVPTVLAAAVIERWGSPEQRTELLPDLVAGSAIGAVAWAGGELSGEPARDGGVRVSGTLRPVLGAGMATLLVAPVAGDGGGPIWCVLDAGAPGVAVHPRPSLDATRRVAEVVVDGAEVPAGRLLAGDVAPERMAALLLSAEAVGVADWCVDTAAGHAKVREQFGRPIGQFQGVKHRCADMLLATEQARSATWEALRGSTGAGAGADDDAAGEDLAASMAAVLAPEAAATCAKDCIQVLGGIGFTWEHDAHLYLKRAMSVRSLLGGTPRWRARVATAAMAGDRRSLAVDLPAEADEHRRETVAFLEDLKTHDKSEWRRRMADAGYLAPHWPPPFGRGAGPLEQLVVDEELAAAHVRRPHLQVGAWALPTIIAHGTEEQQERWVGPTLRGEMTWCQLFSEPGAGSDLASLSTKANRADGGWLLTGQKVWTTMAHTADWGIALARTDAGVPKHEGITCFLVDMRSEGIDIRPLRELTGHEMFNEVFLSDVFVPDDCVVGQVGDGWRAARTTLENERVSMGSGSSFGLGVEALLALVDGGDPVALDAVGGLVAEASSLAALGLRTTLRALSGVGPGPESSVRKLLSAELDQRTQELGLALLGTEGAALDGPAGTWAAAFLANRCLTIAGGTSEVQRNVIAERLLGLPRDP